MAAMSHCRPGERRDPYAAAGIIYREVAGFPSTITPCGYGSRRSPGRHRSWLNSGNYSAGASARHRMSARCHQAQRDAANREDRHDALEADGAGELDAHGEHGGIDQGRSAAAAFAIFSARIWI